MTDLAGALAALDRRARAYTVTAWRAVGRADIAAILAGELIALATAAGDGPPEGTPPPAVDVHAIADVLAVLGADLIAALAVHPDPALEARAVSLVEAAVSELEATVRVPGR